MVNSGTNTNLNATISNARLVSASSVVTNVATPFTIKPSLVTGGYFKCIFNTPKAETLTVIVIESGSGKVIDSEVINSVDGENSATIYLNGTIVNAHYIVTLNGNTSKFESKKIVIAT